MLRPARSASVDQWDAEKCREWSCFRRVRRFTYLSTPTKPVPAEMMFRQINES
ncbi:hypothetical protein FTUN_4706 [Frigoriglobus tundricola]|uniref:Uncharacterized protein n=1 Tax=Frigoriglobus tundricola TaxID=2774151 RepID=A0A6M5YV43_9BACT|nr:hypothetical protein FTUN_4706 [Frigoriglobus tundricola]